MYSHPDIEEILSIKGNNECCDCGAENPKWTSLNNGIFLCLKCARFHRNYGPEISLIYSLQTDHFEEESLVYLTKGGNHKFKINLAEYNISPDSTNQQKYMTKAADYYRRNLENEVFKACRMNYLPVNINKPEINEGTELINERYKNMGLQINGEETKENNNENDGTLLGYVSGFAKSAGQKISEIGSSAGEKMNQIGIPVDKIKEVGSTAYEYAKVGGNYIIEKGTQAYNSEFVQNMKQKAGEGISNVYQRAKSYVTGNNGGAPVESSDIPSSL